MRLAEPRRCRRRWRRKAVRTAHATAGEAITPEQTAELRRLIKETGAGESRFCAYVKVRDLAELPRGKVRGGHSRARQEREVNQQQGASIMKKQLLAIIIAFEQPRFGPQIWIPSRY